MRDVRNRHNLITWGWTKLGARIRYNTSVFKTTKVFFHVNMICLNVLPLSLQLALYSCPRRNSRFLEAVATTRTTTKLAYNTTNYKFLAIQPVRCHVWCSENLLHRFTLRFSQRFLCHRSYACTCLDHELELCGRDSVHAHAQSSRVYIASTLDVTHVIKCTRLSLTLAGRAWERGYKIWSLSCM